MFILFVTFLSNPCLQTKPGLSLPLLKTRVLFVDDVQFTFTANYLTVNATFFD